MSINPVQGKGAFAAAETTTIPVVFTNTVASGNTVCGMVSFAHINSSLQTVSLTSVTDDKSNTYNLETTAIDIANGQSGAAFSLSNITNAPKTITATFNVVAGARSIVVDEFSGCSTASTDQRDSTAHGGQQQASPGTGANGVTSGSFTTATNGDLLYGVTANTGAGDDTGTVNAGTTTNATYAVTGTDSGVSSNTCAEIKSEWAAQSTAGASSAGTFTQSVNVARITFLIAIKPGVGVAAAPFSEIGGLRAIPIKGSAPLQSVFNPNLFTNPIPILNIDSSKPVRLSSIPTSQPYNLALYNIIVTTLPFSQGSISPAALIRISPTDFYCLALLAPATAAPIIPVDWLKPFFPRSNKPMFDSLNLNLFTNPLPFNQFNWPQTRRVPQAPVNLSYALNLDIFTNPIPIFNYIYTPQHKPLPTPLDTNQGFQILYQPIVTITLLQRTLTGVGL